MLVCGLAALAGISTPIINQYGTNLGKSTKILPSMHLLQQETARNKVVVKL
jgi:hypothetical protein